MAENLINDLLKTIEIKENVEIKDINTYSPLTLAYIGDARYELIIRTMGISKGDRQVGKLHKESSEVVEAITQAEISKSLKDILTEEEERVFKRGRNAKSFTTAKNASMSDYRTATGFEALMGYLYLSHQSDRMLELINTGLKNINYV